MPVRKFTAFGIAALVAAVAVAAVLHAEVSDVGKP